MIKQKALYHVLDQEWRSREFVGMAGEKSDHGRSWARTQVSWPQCSKKATRPGVLTWQELCQELSTEPSCPLLPLPSIRASANSECENHPWSPQCPPFTQRQVSPAAPPRLAGVEVEWCSGAPYKQPPVKREPCPRTAPNHTLMWIGTGATMPFF